MKTKIRSHIVCFCALISLFVFAACQNDDDVTGFEQNGEGGYVMLRIGVADDVAATRSAGTTRAPWNDDNAENVTDRSEMMYNWTVLLCDNSGAIKYVYTGTPPDGHEANDNAEIDEVTGVLGVGSQIAAGTYTAYSFANISSAKLQEILGVAPTVGNTLTGMDTKSVSINANLKTTTDITAENAFGLGSKGIPMSNRQTITVTGTEDPDNPQIIDLIVVRMVAKLEFIFFNRTAADDGSPEDFTVKSVTISDITKASTGYLKLLPNLPNVGTGHENEMTFTHGDILPNLNTGFEREEVKYTPATDPLTVASTDVYDISKLPGNANYSAYTKKFIFYVNESQLATPATDRFQLTVELSNGDYRYALVSTGDNSGLTVNKDPENPGGNENATTTPVTETKRSDDWTYIARNDYRIIPIVLDNYRLELVPYDFPAIGVYPASVKTVDANTNLHEILFHDYGHFHLVPHVYRGQAWEGTTGTGAYPWQGKDITFSPTQGDFSSTVWTLFQAGATAASTDWPTAFTSYATTGTYPSVAQGDELTWALNSGTVKFYGAPGSTGLPDDNVWPSTLPVYGKYFDAEVTHYKTIDEENITYSQGDFPMLDTETKWKPKTTDQYRPFIFGQIAPQDDRADKTVYHEFRVNVYVAGESVARQLIYRFYMHLIQDYGLDPVVPSGSRRLAARPTCHLHDN